MNEEPRVDLDAAWDRKRLRIYIDAGGWHRNIEFQVTDENIFSINYETDEFKRDFTTGLLDIDVARRIRDFLNYAVPE